MLEFLQHLLSKQLLFLMSVCFKVSTVKQLMPETEVQVIPAHIMCHPLCSSCDCCVCTFAVCGFDTPSIFLTIMQRFTDRVSHSYRSQGWLHPRCNHHHPETIRAYQVTCRTKPAATGPFITPTYHIITMMTNTIIKFILWVVSFLYTAA